MPMEKDELMLLGKMDGKLDSITAHLGRQDQRIDALGGLDRLVLSADGERAEAVFSVMCAILSLLPALRRPGRAQVTLLLDDGPAVASLQEFLQRLAPRLRGDGISVGLEVVLPPAVPAG